jgi:hypothetical protein
VILAPQERNEEQDNSRDQHAADSEQFPRVAQIIGNRQKAEHSENNQRRPCYLVPRQPFLQSLPVIGIEPSDYPSWLASD